MSPTVKMGEIQVGDDVIPGGWTVKVPRILVAPEDKAELVQYLIRQERMKMADAEREVDEAFQDTINRSWKWMVGRMVKRCAKWYKKRWPQLGLKGFDAPLLAKTFVPFYRRDFKMNPMRKKVLLLMAHEGMKDETEIQDTSGDS